MTLRISEARWPDDRADVEALFREYVASLAEDISFQNVSDELAGLPGKYARPTGMVLIARDGAQAAGAVAYRMVEPGVCEMKRLYVRPGFRGHNIGRALARKLISDACEIGYRCMRLDTVPGKMDHAISLYRELGFKEMTPYYNSPVEKTLFMELMLPAHSVTIPKAVGQ